MLRTNRTRLELGLSYGSWGACEQQEEERRGKNDFRFNRKSQCSSPHLWLCLSFAVSCSLPTKFLPFLNKTQLSPPFRTLSFSRRHFFPGLQKEALNIEAFPSFSYAPRDSLKERAFHLALRMMGLCELNDSEFVEVDPTGRYGRYNEILGRGASKIVYKAFDEYEGIEVAWNQVKLHDFLQSPENLERLYCEIHLLKTLKHRNIMKFYASWVDTEKRNINFITEMFTSGTLKLYRQRHKRVHIRAVKNWCRQILRGLLYLHSHDPPVIHRDLKCDNIFVNGNQGEIKIGDLGLAAILRKSHAARCVGTTEFMAPEVYEEEYNELVDIYSFGMCVLEMVTFEYPYSECTHPAQIYKRVTSGKKPEAFYRIRDPAVRQFVDKCLATVSERLSARELLKDPFLQIDELGYRDEIDDINPHLMQPLYDSHHGNGSVTSCYSDREWGYEIAITQPYTLHIFSKYDEPSDVEISVKEKSRNDEHIFLALGIADEKGRVWNIDFRFDIQSDTALSVATEMVEELGMSDQDVTAIADMIDREISGLVPEWKPRPALDEISSIIRRHCSSDGSSYGPLYGRLTECNHDSGNFIWCCRVE